MNGCQRTVVLALSVAFVAGLVTETELQLKLQPDSGLLTGYSGPSLKTPVAVPRYLLVPNQGTNALGIAGKVIAQSSYVAVVLVHLSQPARVEWSTAGTSPEGFMTSGQPATAIVYSDTLAAERRPCATFDLIGPPNFTGRWPYSVQSGGHVIEGGSLAALQTVALTVPLHARANGTATAAPTPSIQSSGFCSLQSGCGREIDKPAEASATAR